MKMIRSLLLLFILILSLYSFEYDSSGIPIMIVQNRFDNAWSDTLRDTVISYKKINKVWYILKWNKDYFLSFPQFLIFKDTK